MLTLREVNGNPEAAKAFGDLSNDFSIRETTSGLTMEHKSGEFRRFLYDIDDLLKAARRYQEQRPGTAGHHSGEQHHPPYTAPRPDDLVSARLAIVTLEERVARLRSAGKALIEQRERWKARALAAEERLIDLSRAGSDPTDMRYATLRRFLAKRLHPDRAPGSDIERMILSEVFKEIWGEIERIDAG